MTTAATPNLRRPAPATARLLLALACGCAAATAQAQGWTQVLRGGNAGNFDTTVINAPVVIGTPPPIHLGYWPGAEHHYAAASGAHQTLRAVAAGGSTGRTPDDSNRVNTTARFTWVTPVGPGSSGLSVGDPITVYLDVRVDGRLAAGWSCYFIDCFFVSLPNPYRLETYATANLGYGLYDLDAPYYEEGVPDLGFNYVGHVSMTAARYPEPYADQYRITGFGTRAWTERHDFNDWNWAGNDFGTSITHDTGMPSGESLHVNTGVLRFAFDTFVGHRLQLVGELNAFVSGFQGEPQSPIAWDALADFGSTFDAELVSSVAGVEFGALTAGVYNPAAVPEPASPALLLAGLAAMLGFLARRRRREA